MGWRRRKKREREKQRRQADRRQRGPDWPAAALFLVDLLSSAAPEVEAAGSLDRAVEAGVIGGSREMLDVLRRLLPVRLGGKVTAPNAEADWKKVVDQAVAERNLDLDRMRQFITSK